METLEGFRVYKGSHVEAFKDFYEKIPTPQARKLAQKKSMPQF